MGEHVGELGFRSCLSLFSPLSLGPLTNLSHPWFSHFGSGDDKNAYLRGFLGG